jgi:hypothetical protein
MRKAGLLLTMAMVGCTQVAEPPVESESGLAAQSDQTVNRSEEAKPDSEPRVIELPIPKWCTDMPTHLVPERVEGSIQPD